MVLGDIGELLEMFKNSFPFSFLFFIPILIILSPVSPVSAAHEFAALRMQQYDLHGVSYGKYPTQYTDRKELHYRYTWTIFTVHWLDPWM